jgi:hypothetical protein
LPLFFTGIRSSPAGTFVKDLSPTITTIAGRISKNVPMAIIEGTSGRKVSPKTLVAMYEV